MGTDALLAFSFLSSLVAQATGRSYPYLWWFSFLNNTAFTDTPLQVCFRGDSKPHPVDSKDLTVKRASQGNLLQQNLYTPETLKCARSCTLQK